MIRAIQITIGLAALSVAFAAEAQKPIVYPAKGQSASQQSKDEGECYAWAKRTTGIDPAVVASSPPIAAPPAAGRTGVSAYRFCKKDDRRPQTNNTDRLYRQQRGADPASG
jgi:hypothetical protein